MAPRTSSAGQVKSDDGSPTERSLTRPRVLLHLSIGGLMLVGFFGLAMIAGLMTFLDADAIEASMRARRRRQSESKSVAPDAGVESETESVSATT